MRRGDLPFQPHGAHSPAPTGPPEEGAEPSPSPGPALSLAKGHTPLRAAPVQTPASLVQVQAPQRWPWDWEAFESSARPPVSPLPRHALTPRGLPAVQQWGEPRNAHWCFERLGKAVTTTILKQMAWPSIMISESYRLLIRPGKQEVASILETLVRSLLNREWERNYEDLGTRRVSASLRAQSSGSMLSQRP